MNKVIASMWVFKSESNPTKLYQTLQYTDGSTSCECPGWKFKKKTTPDGERTCKHTREIESGTADIHAINKVEYSTAAKRTPQRANTPTPQPVFDYRPNRLIELED